MEKSEKRYRTVKYSIHLTPLAVEMFRSIRDKRVQRQIGEKIDKLITDPEKQGKPLQFELSGCFALRVSSQRYRIIYRIKTRRVVILAVGIRKSGSKRDVYALAKKLIRAGLVE